MDYIVLLMVEDSLYGPTVLWGQLKGKKVKSNDGKDLGDIDKISQNYIRLEKGTVLGPQVLGRRL